MMGSKEILEVCLKKGLLLDKEVLNLFSETEDNEGIKILIENVSHHTQQKVITKEVFKENKEKVGELISNLPVERRRELEKLKIKLGLSIEISKEVSKESRVSSAVGPSSVKVLSMEDLPAKKLEVKDFVSHFRNRFKKLSGFLQSRAGIENLVSIGKISGNRQGISILGLVSDRRMTKNGNLIMEVEDLTGKMKVLVNKNKEDLLGLAQDIPLDVVLGFKGSGNNEILFVNEIIFPEMALPERKRAPVEEHALFIGDIHYGSKLFFKESFENFIDYLNGKVPNTPEVSKIKYLFIVGDVVSGVGNYPSQEKDLETKDIEEQFIEFAKILGRIRKDIKIIISPGNHDSTRIMEPQPIFAEKFAWPLHQLENVILVGNPAKINIASREGFKGFDILSYHGFSFLYYADNIDSLMKQKAQHTPEKIAKFLLKFRHLAPTHSSTQYFPGEKDPLLLEEIPDIFVSAHLHKSAVTYYNNVLIVSTSSWEGMTPYEEKMGMEPDFCKVPMINLKTREIKILDFEEQKEVERKVAIKEEMKDAK